MNARLHLLLGMLTGLSIGDAVMTMHSVAGIGFEEMNPLLAPVVAAGWVPLLAAKCGPLLALTVGVAVRPINWRWLAGLNLIYLTVLLWHLFGSTL